MQAHYNNTIKTTPLIDQHEHNKPVQQHEYNNLNTTLIQQHGYNNNKTTTMKQQHACITILTIPCNPKKHQYNNMNTTILQQE